jgi:hypothetical protein
MTRLIRFGATNKDRVERSTVQALSEWRFVAGTILVLLVFTTIPYVYAYLSTPADKQFMGLTLNVPDHMQYFSWMRELTHSNLSANKLTPEPNAPIFFNLLWWGLARLSLLLGINYLGIYQILRIVSTVLFLILSYRLCAWFLEDRLQRRTAFLIIALTSGFGWVLVLLKYTLTGGELIYPNYVYIAEANTFLGVMSYPHFIAAALYILVFYIVLQGERVEQLRYSVAAGLVALFFGWQHAYDLALVYGVLGGYILLKFLRDRRIPWYLIKSSIIIGVISWWPALYSVILTTLDPLWSEVLAQFSNVEIYSPPPHHLPILLGFAFLLALFTLVRQNFVYFQELNNNDLFIAAWFVSNFFLIYIPTDFQIHMLNGWQVPIAILAAQGLFRYIIPWVERAYKLRVGKMGQIRTAYPDFRRIVAYSFVLMILPTNLYLWSWRILDLSQHDYPYYLYNEEVGALEWLEKQPGMDSVVFSSLTFGQYVPALTGKHAFLAHWAQTVDFYSKGDMVNEFYDSETDNTRRLAILQAYNVKYVIYGPAERLLGEADFAKSAFLEEVFSSSKVQIFEVRLTSQASNAYRRAQAEFDRLTLAVDLSLSGVPANP